MIRGLETKGHTVYYHYLYAEVGEFTEYFNESLKGETRVSSRPLHKRTKYH